MDWIIGVFTFVAIVISVSALRRISNMQVQITRKFEMTLRSALGALKNNADENDKLLKKMSDRILGLERTVNFNQRSEANKNAEISKLLKENQQLRNSPIKPGGGMKRRPAQ